MIESARRRDLEEKQAFHSAMVSIPYFISCVPTTIIATSRTQLLPSNASRQYKLYHSGQRFIRTTILFFNSVSEATEFRNTQKAQIEISKSKGWCQYCKNISHMIGIFYQPNKVYVPAVENKELRGFLNDVSQLVVVDGVAVEEVLRREGGDLFRFLEQETTSVEQYYYRWRVYSYLQGDGQKRHRSEPFQMIQNGPQWYPPVACSIHCLPLNHRQRSYFSHFLSKLTRRKQQIEEGMVFSIHNIASSVEIVSMVVLEIFDHLDKDFIPFFHLISDILFNTTTQNYRKLFARMIPFALYQYAKNQRDRQGVFRKELRALIQIWEIKFIFEDCYTQGLLFLLEAVREKKGGKSHHDKLKRIGNMEDQRQSEMALETLCFSNGIPFIEREKQECLRIINEYLWQHEKQVSVEPQVNENHDGEKMTEKDILKIRNKQVKVICPEGLPLGMLMDKNWQTRGKSSGTNSIDES